MAPLAILDLLWAHGFKVGLVDNDRVSVSPSSTLPEDLRELLKANKSEIVQLLRESEKVSNDLMNDLIRAAMRACDHHGDGPASRDQMRRECRETPEHLRADLLAHFTRTYNATTIKGAL